MIQTLSDFLIFLGWAWENSTFLIGKIFLPIQYVYTFLKQFFSSAFSDPIIQNEIWAFDNEIIAIFEAIPYWNILIYAVVLGITIIFGVFIVKQFLRT